MRPRLSEIALLADVSEATVSRVLNARPGVANATRSRVLQVISDLGYEDVHRQSTGTGAVAIVTPELSNPIFPHLAQQIESVLAHHGYISFVCSSTSETVHEQDFLDYLVGHGVAGIVVMNGRYSMPGVGYAPYEAIAARGLPIVLVNGFEGTPPVPAVTVDIAAAAESATRHLGNLGHQGIGLVVGPSRYATADYLVDGFRRGLDDLGVAFDDGLVSETPWTIEGGQAGAAKLLERGVTGIVCGNDLMAVGVVSAVRAWGARVPEDVSVIGFDGSPIARFTDPPLTTLRQPVEAMARAIASVLVGDQRSNGTIGAQRFKADLVIGQSTARAPIQASA